MLRLVLAAFSVLVLAASIWLWRVEVPTIAAYALLKPARHRVNQPPPDGCADVSFAGAGITLEAWRCTPAAAPPRATLILLHGIADNRGSWRGIVPRFTARGFDVVAFDGRAHGGSGGDFCTYGFLEKQDLRRVIDALAPDRAIVLGTSLGAAIALQEAADDPRVHAVVAAETFSDLRTVATERAPSFLTSDAIRRAFARAEAIGGFAVDEVSPERAAHRIHVPVLLIHGAQDLETPPDHSRRVYAALAGRKRLMLIEGVGHNHSLSAEATWNEIERWILENVE